MGITVFGMGFVALIAWAVCVEMVEECSALLGEDHSTARFWALTGVGCMVITLALFAFWLFGVVL